MDEDEAGPPDVRLFTRLQLYNLMQSQGLKTLQDKFNYLDDYLCNLEDFSNEDIKVIRRNLSHFKAKLNEKWNESKRMEERFLEKNGEWLSGTFSIPRTKRGFPGPGRPSKCFSECSKRGQRRKTKTLRTTTDLEELSSATQSKLYVTGFRDASFILREMTRNPQLASQYKKALETERDKGPSQLTPTEALCMIVEADLSRSQYEVVRGTNKKLYPSYSLIQKEKKDCYPKKEMYRVTDTCAEVELQSLVDITATRLFKYLACVLETLDENERLSLVLFYKWGCDGAHQAQYKQKFENDSNSDANLFQTSCVPLQLICSTNNKVVWKNPTPSSPRYCRPVRFKFVKETKDVTNEEIDLVKSSIEKLISTQVVVNDNLYYVKHTMMLTMIDGKICNAATNTSYTMRCYICGMTSKDFNNLNLTREVNPDSLEFGLSVLHARIRLLETVLHIAYKLPIKQWQLKTEEEKALAKVTKERIQLKFWSLMGLKVDVPRQGYGNSNDGNTSRRFFANHEMTSNITGVDKNLIYRFKVILETLSSGHEIDVQKFSSFTRETAELYVSLYPWYPMTPTLHKILIHGPLVVEKALLPIGQLSEEASEARNKHFRRYRENFARKFSRVACNTDVLNRLLITSDPLLTGMRPMPKKRSLPFTSETLSMLLPASVGNDEDSTSDEDDEDSLFMSDDD